MIELNKNQKIIIIVMGIIILIVVGYYLWDRSKEASLIIEQEETEEIQENKIEENTLANEIIVHIAGAVENSGIQKLPENSRIADAIEAAGGLTSDANTNSINLAQKIMDGQKIYIPNINEDIVEVEKQTEVIVQIPEETNNANVADMVNINIATQTELESLPRNRTFNC